MSRSTYSPPPVIGDNSVTPIKRSDYYDNVAAGTVPAAGTVVSSGFLTARNMAGTTSYGSMPGVLGMPGGKATETGVGHYYLLPFAKDSESGSDHFVRGTTVYVKGTIKARSATSLLAAFEKFAIGVGFNTVDVTVAASFGHGTETTRDDMATVAAVVDATNNIQGYNCVAAGNAAYTDSTFDADLTAATQFEVIVQCPGTADTDDDLRITIKIADSGGTLRTVHNAVTPAATTTIDNGGNIILLLNVDATVYNLCYKIEVAA